MTSFVYHFKVAWHSLIKKPEFIAAVVVTMAVALGALLCVSTLANLLLFEPLPYPDQHKLYKVERQVVNGSGEIGSRSFNYPGLINLYKDQTVFSDAALVYYGYALLESDPLEPTIQTGHVSPEWFAMLGAKMHLGRGFEASEALDSFNPVAVLSYDTWKHQFGSADDILSQKITVKGVSFRIIGVLVSSFAEPEIFYTGQKTDIWFPWDYNFSPEIMRNNWQSTTNRQMFVGKLRDEFSVQQAQQLTTELMDKRWQQEVVGVERLGDSRLAVKLHSFQSVIIGGSKTLVYFLLVGALGIVAIASANISNLFASRVAEQQNQLAIHAAVGARKVDLFFNQLSESLLLMLMAIVVALFIANAGFWIMQRYLYEFLPRIDELALSLFTFTSAMAALIVFALFFALLTSRLIDYRALNHSLQSSGKGTGFQVSKRVRNLLMISQVTVATLLVLINVVLFQASLNTLLAPMGVNVNDVASIRVSNKNATDDDAALVNSVMSEIQQGIRALPQVVSVSQSFPPLSNSSVFVALKENDQRYRLESKSVDHQYFQMVGQPLLEGDFFSAADILDNNNVAIVNDVFAKRIAEGSTAVGKHFLRGQTNYTIVGVVKGVRVPGDKDVPMRVYFPSSADTLGIMFKTQTDQRVSREQLLAVIKSVNSRFVLTQFDWLESIRGEMLFGELITAVTTVTLSLLTFFLAGIGLYGVLVYTISMRRSELGVRMAIGANRKDIVALMFKDNAFPVAIGLLLGLILSLLIYTGLKNAFIEQANSVIAVGLSVTLLSFSTIIAFTIYWPLRKYINQPVTVSLRGNQ